MLFQVCICGWHSEGYPGGTIFFGLGGQLGCSECTNEKRNQNIEVYGNVEVVNHIELFRIKFAPDPEAEFRKVQNEHFEAEQKEIMEERERKVLEFEEEARRSHERTIRLVSKYKGRGKFKK